MFVHPRMTRKVTFTAPLTGDPSGMTTVPRILPAVLDKPVERVLGWAETIFERLTRSAIESGLRHSFASERRVSASDALRLLLLNASIKLIRIRVASEPRVELGAPPDGKAVRQYPCHRSHIQIMRTSEPFL